MELGAGPAPATWQHPRIVSVMDAWQRDFPCVPEPFAVLARHHGYEVEALLHDLHEAQTHRVLGRIGGVFAPNTVGASTLAAVAVPPEDIARAAAIVNRHPEVNHNYEREHAFNLWFVAAADHAARLREVLDTIGEELGVPVHDFPLEAEYHIDLGFSLQDGSRAPHRIRPQPRGALSTDQRRLMTLLGQGLALVEHPYADWAYRLGWTEAGVLAQLRHWQTTGVLRRFGCIVRHHELGYTANAMCVWQVPPDARDALGERLAAQPGVNLCYGRPSRGEAWPYNLFCMVHGKDREAVRAQVTRLAGAAGLADYPHACLFSRRRFKQTGAMYGWQAAPEAQRAPLPVSSSWHPEPRQPDGAPS